LKKNDPWSDRIKKHPDPFNESGEEPFFLNIEGKTGDFPVGKEIFM